MIWGPANGSVSAACGTIKYFNEGQTFINFFCRELDMFYLEEKIKYYVSVRNLIYIIYL